MFDSDYDYDFGDYDDSGWAQNPIDSICPFLKEKVPGCNLIFLAAGAILILISV